MQASVEFICWMAVLYMYLLFSEQLSVRGKNKKEKLSGFFKNMTQSADEVLLANQKVIYLLLLLSFDVYMARFTLQIGLD